MRSKILSFLIQFKRALALEFCHGQASLTGMLAKTCLWREYGQKVENLSKPFFAISFLSWFNDFHEP